MSLFRRPHGMSAFLFLQSGQFFSITGSAMARFALTLFAWEQTQQATTLSLMAFFGFLPVIVLSPLAGALVDRWNKKVAMMMSDLGAACASLFIFLMASSGQLQIWHLYLAVAVAGAFETFQFPAYSASLSVMLRKKDYARASALQGIFEQGAGVIAPVLAGALFGVIGLNGILFIDLATFSFAFSALLWIVIPNPPPSDPAKRASLLADSVFGFRYIWRVKPLLGVQMIFFAGNFLSTIATTLMPAMILARTQGSETALGTVNGVLGAGAIAGGVLIAWRGVPQRRVDGVVGAWVIISIFNTLLFGLASDVAMWSLLGAIGYGSFGLVNGSNQALWMSKVPPALQGRVFSTRRLIAQVSAPLAMFIAGPLADRVFEPAMQPNGALALRLGGLFGTGAGAGMAVMTTLAGALLLVVVVGLYAVPAVRHVDALVPDHEDSAEG